MAYLRGENRRKDEIIMQQAMTMRQLTAAPPQVPPEASEPVEAEQELDTERARRQMAESTLRAGMDEEARRREEAERERDDLRRELHALREARQSPETVEQEAAERAEPRPATGEAQEGARKPWWRRVLGG